MTASLALIVSTTLAVGARSTASHKLIRNYTAWTDMAGNPIACNDGGITRIGETFYWYGTSYRRVLPALAARRV